MENKSEMALNMYNSTSPTEEEDDYIDMEVNSYNSNSFNPRREFEFQMSTTTKTLSQKESSTSPADELFYKGKLLPLHLPPRLQMLEKLLQNSSISIFDYKNNDTSDTFNDFFSTPLTTTTPSTTTCTPFESCNISPADSCQVSGVINPDDYLLQFSKNVNVSFEEGLKKSWTTKFKLIKQTSFGSKIKASRTYLKSLFSTKNGCKTEECSVFSAEGKSEVKSDQKAKTCSIKYKKIANEKAPFEKNENKHEITTSSNNESKKFAKGESTHRRSFSGAIKRHVTVKSSFSSYSSSSLDSSCSSASSSNNSNGFRDLQSLKRSISSNLEVENSIQGAITHCKESQQPQQQQLLRSRKTLGEVGLCSHSPLC